MNHNQNTNHNINNNYQPPKASLDTQHLDITKSAYDSTKSYPKALIILSYTLLGGMLGGLILWIGFSFFVSGFILEIRVLGIAIIGGGIVGFVPALIVSLIIVYFKIHRSTIADDIKVFAIGASFPAIIAFILTIGVDNNTDNSFNNLSLLTDAVVLALVMALIGGISSLIIGYFVLPKDDALPKNDILLKD